MCLIIYAYIQSEESILLNVLPANVDFSTCEALALSRAVDPKGDRTVGVITKIDKCEPGIGVKLETAVQSMGVKLG